MQHIIDTIRNTNLNKYPNADLNNRLVFAIRGTDNTVRVGDVLDASYVWVDNNQTNDKLSGTCACKIIDANALDSYDDASEQAVLIKLIDAAINNAKSFGQNLILVYGIDTGEIGNDDFANEVVIDDCTVLQLI